VHNSELGGTAWQISSRGSVAYLDGMTSFTRQIRDAFAVVNVGNFEGVRVYAENQEIGRTNNNGQLFVPGLRPYQKNQLRIEVDDLPLNTNIDSLKYETAPYFRSGVVVNFGVRVAKNVILRAVLPDGSPVPEGAVASFPDQGGEFPVGLDGLLYLQGIDRATLVGIRWGGTTCDVDVPVASGDAIIPNLGDIVCEPRSVQ
jgi:outer membrane usher protein